MRAHSKVLEITRSPQEIEQKTIIEKQDIKRIENRVAKEQKLEQKIEQNIEYKSNQEIKQKIELGIESKNGIQK